MKIRSSFVSNSSSSSFCIYGATFTFSEICDLINMKRQNAEEDEDACDWEDVEKLREKLPEFLKKKGLKNFDYITDGESGYTYIGRSYENLEENETGKEFRNSVENGLKKFVENKEVRYICSEAQH